ncbi:hypothetical protein N9L68_09210 [bacterium]|nr:hypothetical protein [bacterium]
MIAGSMDWSGCIFDVGTAFLTGGSLQRDLYTRAPREGMPAIGSNRTARPIGPLESLKGAWGLTEAPTLWYSKSKSLLESIGAEGLKIARAVFLFRDMAKECIAELVATMILYVDDGLLCCDPKGPRLQEIKEKVDSVFNIKHWKSLGLRAEKHLGMQWQVIKEASGASLCKDASAASLCIHMDAYIDGLKDTGIKGKDAERSLEAEELVVYRSTLAKVRWPVDSVVLGLAYGASALAQHNTIMSARPRSTTRGSLTISCSG